MTKTYLDTLPVTGRTKQKIVALGASSPELLYFMIKASPEAMRSYFGVGDSNRLQTYFKKKHVATQSSVIITGAPRSPRGGVVLRGREDMGVSVRYSPNRRKHLLQKRDEARQRYRSRQRYRGITPTMVDEKKAKV